MERLVGDQATATQARGEVLIAIDPFRFGNAEDPVIHADRFFEALLEQQGTRLPGDRRVKNRKISATRGITVP